VATRAWVVDDPMEVAVYTTGVVHFSPLVPLVALRVQGLDVYVPLPPVPVVEKVTDPVGRVGVPVSTSVTTGVQLVVTVKMWIVVGVHVSVVVVTRFVTVMFCAVAVLVEWLLSPA